MKKRLISVVTFILLLCMTWEASACSLLFVGGKFTDDGGNLFVRVEDGDMNDDNRLFMVSPAGRFKEGQTYIAYFGFTWTFTHDSYRYLSR